MNRGLQESGASEISGRCEDGDAVGLRRLEGVPQVLEGGRAAVERLFGRSKALRDHRSAVLGDHGCLSLHEVREALHAKRLGRWGRDQQDVRHRRHRVRPLDIERDFDCPGAPVLLTGRTARTGQRVGRGVALLELAEGRATAARQRAFLAAHMGKAKRVIEDLQVVAHRLAAKGVDDDDRLPLALVTAGEERRKVVRILLRRRVEAAARDGVALRLCGRHFARFNELYVTEARMEDDSRRHGRRRKQGRTERRRSHS